MNLKVLCIVEHNIVVYARFQIDSLLKRIKSRSSALTDQMPSIILQQFDKVVK